MATYAPHRAAGTARPGVVTTSSGAHGPQAAAETTESRADVDVISITDKEMNPLLALKSPLAGGSGQVNTTVAL
jgi:hypothetical protein